VTDISVYTMDIYNINVEYGRSCRRVLRGIPTGPGAGLAAPEGHRYDPRFGGLPVRTGESDPGAPGCATRRRRIPL